MKEGYCGINVHKFIVNGEGSDNRVGVGRMGKEIGTPLAYPSF